MLPGAGNLTEVSVSNIPQVKVPLPVPFTGTVTSIGIASCILNVVGGGSGKVHCGGDIGNITLTQTRVYTFTLGF